MPRKYTPDDGAIVPKKYRVTKEFFHGCSQCTIKFESEEVMRFHEKCHLSTSVKQEAGKVIELPKGFLCPVCESSSGDKLTESELFPKWGRCAWHLWKEHRIDCELYTCSVCKVGRINS